MQGFCEAYEPQRAYEQPQSPTNFIAFIDFGMPKIAITLCRLCAIACNVVIIELGMLIPPLGMNVFLVKGVAPGIPLADICRGVAPYVASNLVRLGVLLAFPALTLWLPQALKG